MTVPDGCKVDLVCDQHDLDALESRYESVDDRLLTRWTGADGRSADGYKTLTEWFNKRLLKQAYDEQGRETVGTRLDSEYDVLTGDDDLARQELADDLADDGVDVEQLTENMVSWSTMRHHLQDCLNGEKEKAQATTDWERESIDIARNIAEEKVGDSLRSLASKGKLPGADEAEIDVDVKLSCPECPTRISVTGALERGYVCEHLSSDSTT